MSNQYQYRKADKGLYGPLKKVKPPSLPITFDSSIEAALFNKYDREMKDYEDQFPALPRVASVPSCEWKDGEIVEEKDFRFEQWCSSRGHDERVQELPLDGWLAIDSKCPHCRLIAVPISGGEVKEPKATHETVEEAAYRYAFSKAGNEDWNPLIQLKYNGFKDGAKWQAATPSVDAGKETFTRKQVADFALWVGENYRSAADGYFESIALKNNHSEYIPAEKLFDEYLNQLNKQK